jgi:hypothetical protein
LPRKTPRVVLRPARLHETWELSRTSEIQLTVSRPPISIDAAAHLIK